MKNRILLITGGVLICFNIFLFLPKILFFVGNVLNSANSPQASINFYEKAKACKLFKQEIFSFRETDYYTQLGIVLMDMKRYPEAEAALDRALHLDNNNEIAHEYLGVLSVLFGKFDLAFICFNNVIRINPNRAGAYGNRGLTYKKLGDTLDAEKDYIKALEMDPNSPEMMYNLAQFYDDIGQVMPAIKYYQRLLKETKLTKQNQAMLVNAGACLLQLQAKDTKALPKYNFVGKATFPQNKPADVVKEKKKTER
jgi:tetratricopeptide (TPR) repeat protein